MDDLVHNVAHDTAKTATFSVGFGMLAAAITLWLCCRYEVDHLVLALFTGGAFHVFAKIGKKLDVWWR
jgi:hypothetical protein